MHWRWPEDGMMPKLFNAVTGGYKMSALFGEGSVQLPENVVSGRSDWLALSPGLSMAITDMRFERDTEFMETYPQRDVLSLSFCIDGRWAWSFGSGKSHEIGVAQCCLQSGQFTDCHSSYEGGTSYRAVTISLDRRLHAEIASKLESAKVIGCGEGMNTCLLSTSPRLRLALQQALNSPGDMALRRMYLEGKALELLSVFCEELAVGESDDVSHEDYQCLIRAREFIDRQFTHPLTIAQIAAESYLSETKLKQGFKTCFGCTVYEYIVEKRMDMAYSLLQSGKYRVKDVVWMCGYTNASHFSDLFRKRYGSLPKEFSGTFKMH